MNKSTLLSGVTIVALGILFWGIASSRATEQGQVLSEYLTLRWDGPDNTHIIRPDGTVESLGPKFDQIQKPSRTDSRSFYMNLAVNALAKQGYEVVAITSEDYLLRRQVIARDESLTASGPQ